jgi:hypothetical protein
MKTDSIKIEVLADGTLKVTTDKVSAANHMNADQFLKHMARLAGGETTITRNPHAHGHVHNHDHEESHA